MLPWPGSASFDVCMSFKYDAHAKGGNNLYLQGSVFSTTCTQSAPSALSRSYVSSVGHSASSLQD